MSSEVKLALIVARARNGVIGRNGTLPWRLGDDLQLFKEVTSGHPMVMGRRTWESLPRRPLPGRKHIVLTSDWTYDAPGARVYSTLVAAIHAAKAVAAKDGKTEAFVIGGANVYEKALGFVDRIYLTEVHADIDGDTRFPDFDMSSFSEVSGQHFEGGGRNDYPFTFRVLDRADVA